MDQSFCLDALPAIDVTIRRRRLPAGEYIMRDVSHAHREFEVHVVLQGDMSYEVDGRVYLLSRGCAITTRPHEIHRLFHLSEEECQHYWLTIAVDGDAFPPSLPFPKPGAILLTEAQLTAVAAVLDDALAHNDPLIAQLSLLQLLRLLNEGEHKRDADHRADLPDDVVDALQYMDRHLAEDIRSHHIAAACCISVSTLERRFKTALNASPMTVLRKKRLAASTHRLAAGDSVVEASLNSGFSDYSHYVQLFKKQYGITPLQYKKNNLKK